MSDPGGTLRRLSDEGHLNLPLPAGGHTASRHASLLDLGRADTSLARLAEAHTDATAILAEAGRTARRGDLYGVWAAESHDQSVSLVRLATGVVVRGTKAFCTGAGIVDRALVTVTEPARLLIDVDLRATPACVAFDHGGWVATAFAETATATTTFCDVPVADDDIVGGDRWYLDRPGFWHGACGPAACWAGAAIGLVDRARLVGSDNPHVLANLGAMHAAEWGMRAILAIAGDEIDAAPCDARSARTQAMTVRHLVEQFATDIVARFGRTMGPRPLAFEADIVRRLAEVQLYVRQHGAERDLEALGAESKGRGGA